MVTVEVERGTYGNDRGRGIERKRSEKGVERGRNGREKGGKKFES